MTSRPKSLSFKQETAYTCGAAALRTVLARLGITKTEKQVAKLLVTNKVSGTAPSDFAKVGKKLMLQFFAKNYASWSDLVHATKTHHMIVGYFLPREKIGHFSVVEKITSASIEIYDPWDDKIIRYKRSYFDTVWRRGFRYDPERRWFLGIKK